MLLLQLLRLLNWNFKQNDKNGLKSFKGVQRRFNHIFKYKNSIFIDDYAHHPTEIYSVLEGVKSVYKDEKIYCVFQPHRISRLNTLKSKFVKCFEEADFASCYAQFIRLEKNLN